jgi:PAS domain S-box-containing protein
MDESIGFLESELERAVVTMGQAPAEDDVVQISNRLRSQATLRERERRFRGLLDALPAAVYTTDAAGRITYYNDAAAVLWGHRPPLGTSEWCGSWKLYWPDGTPLAHDECPMAIALKEDRIVRGMEAVAERPDGTRVPFIPYPTSIHDEAGKLIGAVNMLVDITDRKRADSKLCWSANCITASRTRLPPCRRSWVRPRARWTISKTSRPQYSGASSRLPKRIFFSPMT